MARNCDLFRCILAASVWILLTFAASCAGRDVGGGLDSPEMGLPPLATLDSAPRLGTALDNDLVLGSAHIVEFDGTDDGPVVKLSGGETPGASMAFAVYQIPARPAPAEPYMLTVTAYYNDPDPLTMDTDEGYYIAYGQFDTEGWVVSGPYYKSVVRLPFAPGVDVVSPGDKLYAAVIALDGTEAIVAWVEVGYDIGAGYEEHLLSPVQGAVAGRGCDIAVDESGNPQIAYVQCPSMLFGDEGVAFVARRDGTEWLIEEVGTPFPARVVQLALGSGGRRALLLEDADTHDFHLKWDDGGGGGFSSSTAIDPTALDGITPSLAFCNSADSGAGALDTAIVVYAIPDAAPNVKLAFLRYDGAIGISAAFFAPTRQIAAIDLYTDDSHMVRTAFPTAPAYPAWDLTFGVYSAVLNAWAFGTPPDWSGVNIGTDEDELVVRACQTGPGEYAAAYILDEFSGVQAGLSGGAPFSTTPQDAHYGALFEEDFELEAFSDGTVAHLTETGSFTLGMYRGRPGSGTDWDFVQISEQNFGCTAASFVVDGSDTAHFAGLDPLGGRLEYYRLDQFGGTEHAVVDSGSGDPGLSFGPAPVATTANAFYVFSMDAARMRILYSRCVNGLWQEEGVPLNAPDVLPYYILGAGYLEERDLLYVVYLDFYDMNMCVISCPPGENNWHREEWGPGGYGRAGIADNEREVGLCMVAENPIFDYAMVFAIGDPRSGPGMTEVVTTAISNIGQPWYLDYSPFDDCWGLMVNADEPDRVAYYERGGNGVWGPPQDVITTSGIGTFVTGAGVVHSAADGMARVVVHEGPVGPFAFQVNVYRELPSGGFAMEGNVVAIDPVLLDTNLSYVLESPDGLPIVVVSTQAALAYWDFKIYLPDGAGGWPTGPVWNTGITSLIGNNMEVSGGLDPAGYPVLTTTEMEESADMFGWTFVYHRW